MIQKFLFAVAITTLLFSCGSNKATSENKDTTESAQIMIPKSSCYALMSAEDTVLLKLEVFPNVVTGILKYHLSGKDKNEGTIEGRTDGNKIFADYTFSSEGITSVRQVAFLVSEGEVIEGFGEMKDQSGRMVFVNSSAIDFSGGLELKEVNCVENDSLFREHARR